jgi:hypothetical protein
LQSTARSRETLRESFVGPACRRSLRLLSTLIFAVLVSSLATAAGSADTIRDPATIACPPGPPGWANPPNGGKAIWDPLTGSDPGLAGRTQVVVNCNYFTHSGNHIQVALAYALPTDLNPSNDFYFGCSSGGTTWTASDRVFGVMSETQWAIAEFNDFSGFLSAGDVPAFEKVANQLLQNAEGYAHKCTEKLHPTDVKSTFAFSFASAAGAGSGTFETTGASNNGSAIPVVEVTTHNITLKFGQGELILKVTNGLWFYAARPNHAPRLVLRVRVAQSQVHPCRRGSSGTLTITTHSLLVRVCGRDFSGGKTDGRLTFYS